MRRCGLRVVVFEVFDDEMVVCRSDINHGDTHCGWRIADAFVVARAEALLVRLEPFTMRAMTGHVVRHRVQAPMRFFQLLFFREQLQPLRLEFGVRVMASVYAGSSEPGLATVSRASQRSHRRYNASLARSITRTACPHAAQQSSGVARWLCAVRAWWKSVAVVSIRSSRLFP
jgi:hypothetical protein